MGAFVAFFAPVYRQRTANASASGSVTVWVAARNNVAAVASMAVVPVMRMPQRRITPQARLPPDW